MSTTKKNSNNKSKTPKPLHNRIAVTLDKPETVSAGGIILPATTFKSGTEGIVIAIGPKVEQIKVGDHIKFGEHAGIEATANGLDFLIMRESDVMIIL